MFNILKRQVTATRPAGNLLFVDFDGSDGQQDTVQCVHCGRHWILGRAFEEALAGNLGFCANCNGIHCPNIICEECKPQERWLDEFSGARNPTAVVSQIKPSADVPIFLESM